MQGSTAQLSSSCSARMYSHASKLKKREARPAEVLRRGPLYFWRYRQQAVTYAHVTHGPRLAQKGVHSMSVKLAACRAWVLGNPEDYLKRDPSSDGFVSCQRPVEGVTVPGCVASMGLLVKRLISIHPYSFHLHQVEGIFNTLSAMLCHMSLVEKV